MGIFGRGKENGSAFSRLFDAQSKEQIASRLWTRRTTKNVR
jgi:hypothetical protein